MDKNEINYERISQGIRRRYIPAVIVILVLVFARQIIISYEIKQAEGLSRVINVAGRQRMLSQKITKDVLALTQFEDEEEQTLYLDELKTAVDTWEESNSNLQTGDLEEGITKHNSDTIKMLFSEIDESHQTILGAAHDIIDLMESGVYSKSLLLEKIKVIKSNDKTYLEGMDQIVSQYDKEDSDKIEIIDRTELILFFLIIVVIVFEVIYIFMPAEKSLLIAFKEINESNTNILNLFKTIHGAMILVDEETFQILLMNKTAEGLVNMNNESHERLNLAECVQWETIDRINIMEKIKAEDKIFNIEIAIRVNDEKSLSFLLSTVKGKYHRNAVILINLFDITLQKQVEESMRKLATNDELTGLYNRHFMDKIVEEEMERSERYNSPISVFILDLDFFKRINDNWGHPVGDLILKQTAKMASENIRKSDFLIRLGGEEFLLLMPNTNLNEAIIVAEKIRDVIENYTDPIVGKYTASFGVTQRMNNESFQKLYERADAALYRAKEEGRNRVVSYENQLILPSGSTNTYLEWKMEWNSGNGEIDEQHQELLAISNDFISMSLLKLDKEKSTHQIEQLIQHLSSHFQNEERILKSIEYPDYQKHANIHMKLIAKVEELRQAYQNGEIKISAFFTFMLDEFIIGHLLNTDTLFFPYIKK